VLVETGCSLDELSYTKAASGVIISERHVITAAHVVRCAAMPYVRVTLPDGRWQRMVVERDDLMFGSGRDIARLEIASADLFGIGAVPPILVWPNWNGIVYATLPSDIGATGVLNDDIVDGMQSRYGDSGTGVYTANGRLVGIVVRAGDAYTVIERLDLNWMVY
jgi:hypothetical protein